MYLRFLKSELYRASRLKCVWILLVFIFVSAFFLQGMYVKSTVLQLSYDQVVAMGEQGYSVESFSEAFNMGLSASSTTTADLSSEDIAVVYSTYEINDNEVEGVVSYSEIDSFDDMWGEGPMYHCDLPTFNWLNVASSYHLIALAVFAGIFFGNAYKNGYDKNLIISNKCRISLYMARIAVVAIYLVILLVFTFLTSLFFDAVLTGSVTWNINAAFWRYTIIEIILGASFCCVIAAVASLTRNTAAAITVGVLLSMGFCSYGLSFLSMLLIGLFPSLGTDFTLADYTLTQNIEALTLHSTGTFVLRALLVAAVYTAASLVGSCLAVKRRDIV